MRLLRTAPVYVDDAPLSDRRADVCAELIFRVLAQSGGHVVVLHVGDSPYLDGPDGEIELAHGFLTPQAIEALALSLLPEAALRSLRANGSVRHEAPVLADLPADRFIIVAAVRRHDIWIEVRHETVAVAVALEPVPSVALVAPPAKSPAAPAFLAADRYAAARQDESLSVPSAEELWSAPQ
jgi:hypothetical protein